MPTRITLFALLLLSCAAQAAPQTYVDIDVQHDARRQVTCWIVNGTGISCLPDSQINIEQPATKTSAPQQDQTEVFQL